MSDRNRINLPAPAASQFIETGPDAHTANAAAAAQAPGAAPSHHLNTPQPAVPHGVLGRLKSSLSRSADTLRARRFDLSTLVNQHSTHGRTSGPENHVEGSKRYAPQQPPRQAQVAGSALEITEELVSQAIAQTALPAASGATPAEQPRPAPLDTVASREDLLAYVQQQFICPPERLLDVSALASRLYHLTPPDTAAHTAPATAATRGALLAQAIRQAGVTDVQHAQLALERVGMLDFHAPHTRHSSSPAEREAWQIARVLSRSSEGFETLGALRASVMQPFTDAGQRLAVKVMLESADALDPTPPGTPYPPGQDRAPGAIAQQAGLGNGPLTADEPGPNALAKRAFDAAATLLEHGRGALTPDQRGAFFAWRQSFSEDERHSDLSQARERLNKFSAKTIGRVSENRWKTLLPRMFRGKHKSPLSALRYGTQGVPRKTVEEERAALQKGLREARLTFDQSAALRPAAALTHARPERSLVELAALHTWLERGGFPHGRMDEDAIVATAQRAQQMSAELQPGDVPSAHLLAHVQQLAARWSAMTPQQLAKTRPFNAIAKQPFTIERLAVWGKVARVADDAPFWASVDTLRTLAEPATPARAADNADDVRATLKDVIEGLPSGARLRLTDGSRQGISTRGLNATLMQAHGIPVSPRLDLRASRTRESVVEVSRATHGVEMFVGTAESTSRHVGAGLMVGYDLEAGITAVRAGLVTNVILHSRELTQPRGVSLRVARRVKPDGSGYDDKAMREKLNEIVDHVFNEATEAHGDGSNGVWNRLAERFFDDPDVSISWTAGQASNTRRGVTVDATATVKLPAFGHGTDRMSVRVGPSLGVGWEKSRQTIDSAERTGRLQVEQHRVGLGSLWQVRGGIAPGFSHALDAAGKTSVGLFSVDTPAATMTLSDRNRSAKLQLVREDGKLNYRACMLDVEFLSASMYTRAVDAARPELIDLFAANIVAQRQREGPQALAGGAAPQEDPQVLAGRRIDQHLATVRKNQRPNLTYMYRYRLHRDAALRLDANAALLAQSGNDPHVKETVDARNAEILGAPSSWMPIELKVKERNTYTQSFGPNMMFQLSTRTSATGDREIVTESVPFDVLETLDEQGV
jgi:cellulose synthase operon protein C